MSIRTRKGLRNGDITVSGESWPIFLYEEHTFNPENPWEGLLQGRLLVTVSRNALMLVHPRNVIDIANLPRLSSIYSHLRALSKTKAVPHVLETPSYME